MSDKLEQIFHSAENKPNTQGGVVSDTLIQQGVIEFVGPDKEDENIKDFAAGILEASKHPSFPRSLFDQSLIAPEYREENLRLDTPFLNGLYTSQYIEHYEEESWQSLILQRQAAIDAHVGDQRVPLSVTESRMVGYIVGRKLATGNPSHLPAGFDKANTRLTTLMELAEHIYPAFRPEFGKETSSQFTQIDLDPSRD